MFTLIAITINIVSFYFLFNIENPAYIISGYLWFILILDLWLLSQIKKRIKFINQDFFQPYEETIIHKYHLTIMYPLGCKAFANLLWIFGMFWYFIWIPLIIYKWEWIFLIIWIVILTFNSYITRMLNPLVHLDKNRDEEYREYVLLKELHDKIYTEPKNTSLLLSHKLFY